MRCEDEPELALRSNVLATALVARAAAAHGARLAYVSTSDVYGAAVADEDTPAAPASFYALTKWWGEQVARLYAPAGLAVLRLANPYGPGHEPGQGKGALPTMLWQAERREPIPAFRGEARSWCWIGDVARGIRLVLEQRRRGRLQHRLRRRAGLAHRRGPDRLRAHGRAAGADPGSRRRRQGG